MGHVTGNGLFPPRPAIWPNCCSNSSSPPSYLFLHHPVETHLLLLLLFPYGSMVKVYLWMGLHMLSVFVFFHIKIIYSSHSFFLVLLMKTNSRENVVGKNRLCAKNVQKRDLPYFIRKENSIKTTCSQKNREISDPFLNSLNLCCKISPKAVAACV